MNLITDLQYFPSVILYKNSNKFSNIVFEQYEHYQKMSFRNRCRVAGGEGAIDLSIPLVKGRDQKTLMKDVRIAGKEKWQDRHWKTLTSCYSRSPWFEFYRDGLEELYRKPFEFLLDWNLVCFEWSLGVLSWPVPFSLTDAWRDNYDPENWTDWRGKWLPRHQGIWHDPMVAGTDREGVREGLDPETNLAGRSADPQDPGHSRDLILQSASPIKYRQVFEERTGFLPNLSILDLLFCEGKRARQFLV